MAAVMPAPAASRLLMSGNEAVARAVWESGTKVCAGYPGTPATEMLEQLSTYPDLYTEWSVNEKVSLEVAIGASMMGARAFCAMKHVGLNVAADPLMTCPLTGAEGGLVIAVADDVGMSSSQNEQDSRFYGRFAHVPILEPADSQEAYDMARYAFELSEEYQVPVILRLTARICHVKGLVKVGERVAHPPKGFTKNAERWVMVPGHAKRRIPLMLAREQELKRLSDKTPLNVHRAGQRPPRRLRHQRAGLHARARIVSRRAGAEARPVVSLAAGEGGGAGRDGRHPGRGRGGRAAAGDRAEGRRLQRARQGLPAAHRRAGAGGAAPAVEKPAAQGVGTRAGGGPGSVPPPLFPRPPTLCASCPHMGIYYTLSQLKNLTIAGDIGCYTLGAGHPWNSLDSTICMGASMGVALGMDKGRGEADKNKKILAVIGDSTFMHMGMQGLLDITWNRGNVTVLLLDNGTVGMTGGQNTPANGRDIRGLAAPRIDFPKLIEALGVKKERITSSTPTSCRCCSRPCATRRRSTTSRSSSPSAPAC
jgi:indolepyruvate ferredoxin oxidoreductase alpha subunit